MKAVILAGGEGTRLRPLTTYIPKPMINIAGKPCIGYVIDSLVKAGIADIIVTTGYLSDKLIKGVAMNDFGYATILYSFEAVPRGTAGAVKSVESYLDSTFVVASGDVLSRVDFSSIVNFHRSSNADITIALTRVPNPSEYGIVELDPSLRVTKFKEKPKKEEQFSNLINAGIYVIEPSILNRIPKDKPYDFSKQLFPELLSDGYRILGMELNDSIWRDIGRPEDLLKATFDILDRDRGIEIAKDTAVDGSAVVEKPVYIAGKVSIGAGVSVIHSAIYNEVSIDSDTIVQDSIVFYRGKIMRGCRIENSIVADDAIIEENCTIKNSVIGNGIVIKKGSTLINAKISS